MKPHEETWAVAENDDGQVYLNTQGLWVAEFCNEFPEPDRGRAKLAAQAPAMARLLWEIGRRLRQDDTYTDITERAARVLRDAGVIP